VAAGVALLDLSLIETSPNQELIRVLSRPHPSGGRLFDSPSAISQNPISQEQLHTARLSVFDIRDPIVRGRIQGLVYISMEDWQKAAVTLGDLNKSYPDNPQLLNDLGVVYLALGEQDPASELKALQFFRQSERLAPTARAPRFNEILIYGKLGLLDLQEAKLIGYRRFERDSGWLSTLEPARSKSSSQALDELRQAVIHGKSSGEELVQLFPDQYRQIAIEYALTLDDAATLDPTVQFIAEQFNSRLGDNTLRMMLAPLLTKDRTPVLQARRTIQAAGKAYQSGNYKESLMLYDKAAENLTDVKSPFDVQWLELNRADAEDRNNNVASSRALLDNVITESEVHHLRWILGKALSAKGGDIRLTSNFAELLGVLNRSIDVLSSIGASRDRVRPLYYLAMSHYSAGDVESSLSFTFRALSLAESTDHLARMQLCRLAGLLTYRMGLTPYGVSFEKQSVSESQKSPIPQLVVVPLADLALMSTLRGATGSAQIYMNQIQEVSDKVKSPADKAKNDLPLNLLCARIQTNAGRMNEARQCLQKNLDIFSNEHVPTTFSLPQTHLALAQVESLSGHVDLARQEYGETVRVIESNDDFFSNPQLRMSFENVRRDTYDAAIGFEYGHGGADASWSYLQRYRSKLLLEFLGKKNAAVPRVHSEAIRRDQVQKMIPPDAQVVEYVMLKDRLLIWLVSDSVFVSRQVTVSRASLTSQVGQYLDRLRSEQDVSSQSQALYRLLIAPIEDKLDPNRVLAIVPDQDLHRLPFAALMNGRTNNYLIERFIIMESPSLTEFLATEPGEPPHDSVVSFGALRDDTSAIEESEVLAKLYPHSRRFEGAAIGKQAFLDAISRSQVFHYSGHSVDASDPLRSSILLDGSENGPNGVTALDISQQHMRSNSVVILASCDSSVGNSRDGVGMRGLTSAFLISGAGSVVGSLWLVETNATSELVVGFHRAFASGTPVAQSLRRAQMAFIKSNSTQSHPYYWSGFVVTGNLSALR